MTIKGKESPCPVLFVWSFFCLFVCFLIEVPGMLGESRCKHVGMFMWVSQLEPWTYFFALALDVSA